MATITRTHQTEVARIEADDHGNVDVRVTGPGLLNTAHVTLTVDEARDIARELLSSALEAEQYRRLAGMPGLRGTPGSLAGEAHASPWRPVEVGRVVLDLDAVFGLQGELGERERDGVVSFGAVSSHPCGCGHQLASQISTVALSFFRELQRRCIGTRS